MTYTEKINEEALEWNSFIKNELRKTKTCPFCGEPVNEIKIEHIYDRSWMEIRCKCGAIMLGREVDPYHCDIEQWKRLAIELISAWNMRDGKRE